jgi:hypothetical protein
MALEGEGLGLKLPSELPPLVKYRLAELSPFHIRGV